MHECLQNESPRGNLCSVRVVLGVLPVQARASSDTSKWQGGCPWRSWWPTGVVCGARWRSCSELALIGQNLPCCVQQHVEILSNECVKGVHRSDQYNP